MIRSMTGYSAMRGEEAGYSLSASVKSTNHRFLDLQVRLPAGLEALEPGLRQLVRDRVARGHVELTVVAERVGPASLQVNRHLMDAYVSAIRELRSQFGSSGEPDWIALLRLPGMVVAENGIFSPAELEEIQRIVGRLVGDTLARLDEMRAQEGEALERDLRMRLERLGHLSVEIEKSAETFPELFRRRLQNRIRDLLSEIPGGAALDAGRLAQETAYLASRSDISEELARFRSHLRQARDLLESDSEVGKKLDFLLQEMNREANTLLSKTTDVPEVGVEVARQAIEMKTEIEKLREQTQNIE